MVLTMNGGLMAVSGNLFVVVLERLGLGCAGMLGRQELCSWGVSASGSVFC